MSQINTNVNSMLAQRVMGQQNNALNQSLERLSTGLRINRGADDPAGLIASENLRSEKASIAQAINNAERADQVVNIAEGGLQEINSLLLEAQSLVTETANDSGLSAEEKQANQQQIDSILQTIDRISDSTSFQGSKLLNGNMDFNVSAQSDKVDDFAINAAKLAADENRQVEVNITQSAQNAGLFVYLSGDDALDLSGADDRFVFELGGADGSREFSFASGTTTSSMAQQINTFREVTGVSASVSGGESGLRLHSIHQGSNQFVSFDMVDYGGQAGGIQRMEDDDAFDIDGTDTDDFDGLTNAVRDNGQDVGAIINGMSTTADGNKVRLNSDFLDLELTLDAEQASTLQSFDAMTITGGGARFSLGPDVNISSQASIGIQSVASRNLGSLEHGRLDDLASGRDANLVDGDLAKAQNIVDDAIQQVSALRGRLGAFQQNTIGSTINSLGIALENTSAAESAVRDTDFARETAEMTRAQILSQAAMNTLGMANQQPQNVLSLLQ